MAEITNPSLISNPNFDVRGGGTVRPPAGLAIAPGSLPPPLRWEEHVLLAPRSGALRPVNPLLVESNPVFLPAGGGTGVGQRISGLGIIDSRGNPPLSFAQPAEKATSALPGIGRTPRGPENPPLKVESKPSAAGLEIVNPPLEAVPPTGRSTNTHPGLQAAEPESAGAPEGGRKRRAEPTK